MTADRSGQPIFSKWRSPSDWPWPITYCVGEARRIISYWENLPDDQRPPKRLWHSRDKCALYIEEHRADGSSGSGKLTFGDHEIER